MNRATLAKLNAQAQALVRVTKRLLDADLRYELEHNETRISADMGWATLTASQEHDSLEVENDQDFLEWVRERYPHNVEVVLRVPNTEWLTKLRGQLLEQLKAGQMTDCPPGTKIAYGGAFKTTSLTVKPAEKTRLEEGYLAMINAGELPVLDIVQAEGS